MASTVFKMLIGQLSNTKENSMSYVLITGASSGIGKALANKFASEGHDIIITARRINVLEAMKTDIEAEHNVDVVTIESDLSVEENAYKLYEQIKAYDVLTMINNAGFGNMNNVADVDISRMVGMINLNVTVLTILSTLFTKDNQDKEAQLINVASVGGYMTMAGGATYVATKFFVSAFTESLALELRLAGSPMQAKVLAPGPVSTEFLEVANTDAKNALDESAFGKLHTPKEMADFTYQLYQSTDVVGIVDMATMTFTTKGAIHPAFGA